MARPRICAVITGSDPGPVRSVEPLVDLFEVRMDLIGDGWPQVVSGLSKPWIACNRMASEGGSWPGSETDRVRGLLKAIELGAGLVDIELKAPSLAEITKSARARARCIISCHDLKGTPTLDAMRQIVHRQLDAGADICKLVTTARKFEDNLAVLQLIRDFPETEIVAFAMGPLGQVSRVLCPLVGGHFTYASIAEGGESAPGQVTVADLVKIYGMLRNAG